MGNHKSLEFFKNDEMTPFEKAERNAQVFVAQNHLNNTFQDAIERWEECNKFLNNRYHLKEERSLIPQIMAEKFEIENSISSLADVLEIEMGISA
tara:strand:+ start:210 stop:494 length:285 start_codon:yes stop_codon:yes gene_type:complete